MNELGALLGGIGVVEYWREILVLVVGGVILYLVQRHLAKGEDEEKAFKTRLETQLNQFGVLLATERQERQEFLRQEASERRDDIHREASERRSECAKLGKDISNVRVDLAFYCGQEGKEKPKFGAGSGER